MAIVMLALSVTFFKLLSVDIIIHKNDLDLWNGTRSNANKIMLIESLYTSFYLTATVKFASFWKNYHAISYQNMHDLAKGKCKYANRKPIYDLQFYGIKIIFVLSFTISNIFTVANRNVHDLDLDKLISIPFKFAIRKPIHDLLYLMAIVIFTRCVIISKIFIVKLCMTFTLTFRMSQGQMQIC